ncbi:MAG: hypothetical protein IT341_10550 [Chloroflexi bacterium]|nr:hypothetical protein [Chloroflexota bacterium]
MRIGTVAAMDKKAAAKWRGQRGRLKTKRAQAKGGESLTGSALEQAVMQIAMRDPGLVALPGVEPRRMSARA